MTPRVTLCFVLIMMSTMMFASKPIGNAPVFHAVKVAAGDGIFSLLRRYGLDEDPCNQEKFYQLNNIKKGTALKRDEKYVIPVYIYEYNGKSIRSTIGIGDWEKAVRIKEYNEMLLKNKLRSTNYIDSRLLWVPYSEISCENGAQIDDKTITAEAEVSVASNNSTVVKTEAKSPKNTAAGSVKKPEDTAEKFLNEPLFGAYHKVKVEDNSLKNKVFYIVSGHGGPDPGAMCTSCPNTLCEDEYAYDVSLRICRELMSKGATVHMIIQDANDGIRDEKYLKCDKDETCLSSLKIPLNQLKRLEQRASAINSLYAKYKKRGITDQVAIMIHVDSRTEEKRQDVFFYHYEHSKSSKKMAHNLQETFRKKYDQFQKNRGYAGFVTSRNLYMIRNTMPTAVYIELANIKNPMDQKRLLINDNREALAQWITEGITIPQE